MPTKALKPVFFPTPAAMRSWLEKHHKDAKELLVGFYKRGCGKPSVTWPESVDAALCYGWIDGVRHNRDEISYTIRFTPRRPTSTWSAINIRRVAELEKLGLMTSAGREAFERRSEKKSQIYSYEQRNQAKLSKAYEAKIKANRKASAFYRAQAPWYRRTTTYWVMTAKKEETRLRRLEVLINCSVLGKRIPALAGKSGV